MKIDISPVRITPDALVVWHEPSEQVDLVADPRELRFRANSVDQIITNHAIDNLFQEEVVKAIQLWKEMLKPGGIIYFLTDDFEYVSRGYMGGDISLVQVNEMHAHASQWDRTLLGDTIISLGFPEPGVTMWFKDVQQKDGDGFKIIVARKEYELLISAKK